MEGGGGIAAATRKGIDRPAATWFDELRRSPMEPPACVREAAGKNAEGFAVSRDPEISVHAHS